MLLKNLLFLICLSGGFLSYSQVGINTINPDPNSMLDIVSTTKGVLIPRLDNRQVNTLQSNNPTSGMLVFNTSLNCVQIFEGSSFKCLINDASGDTTIDAWEDNSSKSRIELTSQSDGTTNRPSGTEFVINDVGNVGVGTSNPDAKLHVRGSNLNDITLKVISNTSNQGIAFQNQANAYTWNIYRKDVNGNKADLIFAGNNTNATDLASLVPYLTLKAGGNVGIGTDDPKANLDVREQNPSSPTAAAGIAIPQVNSLPSSGNRAGQVVYNLTDNKYYYYNGTLWQCLNCNASIGDVKHSFKITDHEGWVRLNGRDLTLLNFTTTQIQQAQSLGFVNKLPNATDRVLKMKGAIGSLGGANSVSLNQANLPNVNFTGSTSTDGSHSHSFADRGSGEYTNRNLLGLGSADVARSTESSNTTNATGNHNHSVTVNSGGSGTAINVEDEYLGISTFIYLGL